MTLSQNGLRNATVVSVKYSLNAFVEHYVAVELSDLSSNALREDVGNI